jgi:surface protein
MSADWEQYFERAYSSNYGHYYSFKHKDVSALPDNLPMPPTDGFYCMFNKCYKLKNISALANWDVSKVKNMECMFSGCEQLQDISALANWDVSRVENMRLMFYGCNPLMDITALSSWDISNVRNITCMFEIGDRSIYDEHMYGNDLKHAWKLIKIFNRKCKEELTQQITELKSVIQQQQQTIDQLQAKINNPIALLWKP